jgi:hypothetical protein
MNCVKTRVFLDFTISSTMSLFRPLSSTRSFRYFMASGSPRLAPYAWIYFRRVSVFEYWTWTTEAAGRLNLVGFGAEVTKRDEVGIDKAAEIPIAFLEVLFHRPC